MLPLFAAPVWLAILLHRTRHRRRSGWIALALFHSLAVALLAACTRAEAMQGYGAIRLLGAGPCLLMGCASLLAAVALRFEGQGLDGDPPAVRPASPPAGP